MDIFDIFAAASFKYAVYSNLAATHLANDGMWLEGPTEMSESVPGNEDTRKLKEEFDRR